MLSFRLNAEIFGLEPWTFRLGNILIHAAAVQLCFRALGRMVGAERALLAAGIFALHPLQSEAVLYVFARPVLLMGALLWWALDRWLAGKPLWALLGFALALGAKEEAVAFPLFLAGLHWARKEEGKQWRWISAMAALAALVMGSTLFNTARIAGSGAGLQAGISPLEYLATQPLVIAGYIFHFFVPWGLAFDAAIAACPLWAAAFWLLPLGLIWKLRPDKWRFWALSALLFLLPTSSVFPLADLAADRRVYMAVALGALGLPSQAKWALPVLLLLSIARAQVWRDPKALWQEAMQASPEKLRPALEYTHYVPPEEGLQTLKAYQSTGKTDARYHTELGRIAMQQRDAVRALGAFGQALALDPEKSSHYYNRGTALLALGQREAAEGDFRRALAIDPRHGPARSALTRLEAK